MTTYEYGAAQGTPHYLRLENRTLKSKVVYLTDRTATLERALRESEYQRRNRARRQDHASAKPYRQMLTPEELTAPPTLRYGDTPEVCAGRLAAANAEAGRRNRHNQQVGLDRKLAA
ncbi:MAG: hypothetical protein QJR09_08035 [Micrococcus sp.]|nr:hypothetical protein [Micrococcus sp.]